VIEMTLRELADVIRSGSGDRIDAGSTVTGSVRVDSRSVRPGDVFVAIRGERFDGHEFLAEVRSKGAVAAIVTDPTAVGGELPLIRVKDATVALGLLATEVRSRLGGLSVIAVTGSSGKTTTKDLLAATLRDFGATVSPPGSFNNDLGLPLTVLEADAGTRYLVLEMGARARGDIARLSRIARPGVGIVLNVGSAHVGEFGSRAGIAEAKRELVEGLTVDGVAVLNADDPLTLGMAAAAPGQVVSFGLGERADVRGSRVELDDAVRPSFDVTRAGERARLRLRAVGEHQVANGLAAVAGCLAVGLSLPETVRALQRASVASRWRMEVTRTVDGTVVINDAYNANPESVAAALRALVAMARGVETVAVLGTMRELGDSSAEAHREVGRLAGHLGVDRVLVVGSEAGSVREGLQEVTGWRGGFEAAADADEALGRLDDSRVAGDVVLVKASRSIGLERVAADLIESHGGPTRAVD